MRILLLMLAGSLGTVSRYLLQGAVQSVSPPTFPYGTFVVNAIGCFAFGVVWSLAEERYAISHEVRIVVLVGFMGAFTTFSTFAFESLQQLRDSELLIAGLNVALQCVVGIALVYAGMLLARSVGGAAS